MIDLLRDLFPAVEELERLFEACIKVTVSSGVVLKEDVRLSIMVCEAPDPKEALRRLVLL